MAKHRRRAYLSELATGFRELDGELSRYLTAVLRLGDGEAVEFFDGQGRSASAVIRETSKRKTKVELLSISSASPPEPEIHIASAIPKRERADWIVEKCSELGARSLSWIVCERSQDHRKDHSKRFARWNKISQEAARQSQHSWLPQFRGPLLLEELLRDCDPTSLRLVLDTTDATTPLAKIALTQAKAITLCIGPEGGFTDTERARFQDAAWQAVTLGPSVLRVETALIVGLGTIQNLSTLNEVREP